MLNVPCAPADGGLRDEGGLARVGVGDGERAAGHERGVFDRGAGRQPADDGRVGHRGDVQGDRVRRSIEGTGTVLHAEREAGVAGAVGVGRRREDQAGDTGGRDDLAGD